LTSTDSEASAVPAVASSPLVSSVRALPAWVAGPEVVWPVAPEGEAYVVARLAQRFVRAERAGSDSARADSLAVTAPAGSAALSEDAHSAQAVQLDDSAPADSLAVLARADLAALSVDAHSARAARLGDSAPADSLAVSAPADLAALSVDAHSARAARLGDSAPADSLAESAPADSAALSAVDQYAPAAELGDSAPADSLAGTAPAGSAAPMTDDLAEQDLALKVVHSEQAGCPDGSPAGLQLADCWVGPVWRHLVDSQVGSPRSPDVPYLASLFCPAAPASPLGAFRPHLPDAGSALRSLPTVVRDLPPAPAAAWQTARAAGAALPWRSLAGLLPLLAARPHDSRSQPGLPARSPALEPLQLSNSWARRRYPLHSRQPPLFPPAARWRTHVAVPPLQLPAHCGSRTSHS